MKILHVLSEIRDFGNGIVNVAVDLACAQAEVGHEVALASGGGDLERVLRNAGVDVCLLPHLRPLRSSYRGVFLAVRVCGARRPEIVHCHTLAATILFAILRPLFGYRLVSTVHNEYQRGVFVMALADRIVCVSEAVARKMAARPIGSRRNRIRVVRNGTIGTRRRASITEAPSLELSQPAIVAVGAVSERKGSMVLVDALDHLLRSGLEAHVYFVGNLDWPAVEEKCRSHGLNERVHFVGYSKAPQEYIRSAAVFALPSLADPYPLVLLEAREIGAAIVATHVDGVPEALDWGEAGVLVPAGDHKALADTIQDLLSHRWKLVELRDRAKRGLSRFTTLRMCDEYLNVYSEVR